MTENLSLNRAKND